MITSEKTDMLFEAFCSAQPKFKRPAKSGKNPHFKTLYSTLEDIWDAIQEALSCNGLMIIQSPQMKDGSVAVCTLLGHKSGQWLMSFLPLNPVKNDPQSVGSAITYAKRYALSALVGIGCDDGCDDDGAAASSPPPAKRVTKFGQNPVTIQPLARMIEKKSIPLHYLSDYINMLSEKHSKPIESVIESAMTPELFERFSSGYAKEVARLSETSTS